jgi:hypothetical protein
VADEGVDEAFAFGWDFDLHSAAVAGCGCGAVFVAVGAFGGKVDLLAHGGWLEVVLNGG